MAETKEIGTEKGEQKPCLTGLCIEGGPPMCGTNNE